MQVKSPLHSFFGSPSEKSAFLLTLPPAKAFFARYERGTSTFFPTGAEARRRRRKGPISNIAHAPKGGGPSTAVRVSRMRRRQSQLKIRGPQSSYARKLKYHGTKEYRRASPPLPLWLLFATQSSSSSSPSHLHLERGPSSSSSSSTSSFSTSSSSFSPQPLHLFSRSLPTLNTERAVSTSTRAEGDGLNGTGRQLKAGTALVNVIFFRIGANFREVLWAGFCSILGTLFFVGSISTLS